MNNPDVFKSGFVSLVGRPNAGKSTLVNAIMGTKIAITSSTPQTTRRRLRAIYSDKDFQMIIIDTPGFHKASDNLGKCLNESAFESLNDADVVVMLVDASVSVGSGDRWVATQVFASKPACAICVLSKCDLVGSGQLKSRIETAEELGSWDLVMPLSAKSGYNIDVFIRTVADFLPNGPAWFPIDMQSDQPMDFLVSEFIREKILRSFYDEIPHSIGVVVEDMHASSSADVRNTTYIYAVIYVERESQKGIIVGKGGKSIKLIGIQARTDLERLLGTGVYLDLQVKVKKNWRRDVGQIHRFGYGEGV